MELRIIEKFDVHAFFIMCFNGMGSVGNPESLTMHGSSIHFSIISSVEWEAWEAKNH